MIWLDYLLFLLPGILLIDLARPGSFGRMPRARGSRPLRASRCRDGRSRHGGRRRAPAWRSSRSLGRAEQPLRPRPKVLRLSPDVYEGRSLTAVAVAAHEAGHAIQDAAGYPGLIVRNFIVPLASPRLSGLLAPARGGTHGSA